MIREIKIGNTTFVIGNDNKVSLRQVDTLEFGDNIATIRNQVLTLPLDSITKFADKIKEERTHAEESITT